jgi:hypothetical protein
MVHHLGMRFLTLILVSALVPAALLFGACGGDDDATDTPTPGSTQPPGRPTPVSPTPVVETPEATPGGSFDGGLTPVEVEAPAGLGQAVLGNIRAARQEGFDRLVFEFNGEQVPGYTVKYATEAIACGSGQDLTAFVGDGSATAGLVLITVRPAAAHDDAGQATAVRDLRPALESLVHVFRTCDFEGVVEYAVALTDEHPYKVTTLLSPPRLIIDFAQ